MNRVHCPLACPARSVTRCFPGSASWLWAMGWGPVFLEPAAERARTLTLLGLAAIALFLLLRATNFYGDPHPWSAQGDGVMTVLSVLNVTKYPPSLLYALVTLGPVFLLLPAMERLGGSPARCSRHSAGCRFSSMCCTFMPPMPRPSRSGSRKVSALTNCAASASERAPPEGLGLSLAGTYAAWILIMAALYPACQWFAGVKRRRRDWWLSYL